MEPSAEVDRLDIVVACLGRASYLGAGNACLASGSDSLYGLSMMLEEIQLYVDWLYHSFLLKTYSRCSADVGNILHH